MFHFLLKGAYEGLQPHPLFDPGFYLRKYPDVADAGVNPWCHYLKYGKSELRQPHPLFDPRYYLEHNPDVRSAKLDPLLHYICNGAAEGRKPHPLFEPKYYGSGRAQNPLVHFLGAGAEAGSPHPLFDCGAYLAAHPDVAAKGVNPLVHYLDSPRVAGAGAMVPAAKAASVARLDIRDVRLTVFCLDGAPDSEDGVNETRLPDAVVLVWQDAHGFTHWIAEPQQLPFLRAVNIDQISSLSASRNSSR